MAVAVLLVAIYRSVLSRRLQTPKTKGLSRGSDITVLEARAVPHLFLRTATLFSQTSPIICVEVPPSQCDAVPLVAVI